MKSLIDSLLRKQGQFDTSIFTEEVVSKLENDGFTFLSNAIDLLLLKRPHQALFYNEIETGLTITITRKYIAIKDFNGPSFDGHFDNLATFKEAYNEMIEHVLEYVII